MLSMGDKSSIDWASCVESVANKNATVARNAEWRTYSSFSKKNETAQKERIQNSHLDTLLILQSPLEHPKHCINLQIHHQIQTPSKDPMHTFPLPRTIHTPLCTLGMRHAERLRLESMPQCPAHRSLIHEVHDGVDALPLDIG